MINLDLIPLLLIFTPIVFSLMIYLSHHHKANYFIFIVQSFMTCLVIYYYTLIKSVNFNHSVVVGGWTKWIGIELLNDQLSFSFIVLTLFMWWIILIYSFDKRKTDTRFYFFLMFLQGTFLGLVQTNDLFNLYLFLEITTILATILIVYNKDGYAVRAGLFYLLFNCIGISLFLIGIILVYNMTGTLNMTLIAEQMPELKEHITIQFAFILIMAASAVKSALFPVFYWLPKAHGAAPSSISALLSGLIVKSGIYIFITMNLLFQYDHFNDFFFLVGTLTALVGVTFALSQKDLKQILAYHTVSQVGLIIMGLSTQDGAYTVGGMLHIFNHALFKSILFLGVGVIIRQYKHRNITEIRGVFKTLPLTSIFLIVGMLSITGAPFFNGFISKSIIKYGIGDSQMRAILFYLINIGTAASFIKFSQIFFGSSQVVRSNKHNEHFALFLLASLAVILGNMYIPVGREFFGVDLSYIRVLSLSNWISYLTTLLIGFLLFKLIIDKDPPLIKKIRHTIISFETNNYLLITYIFVMCLWMFL